MPNQIEGILCTCGDGLVFLHLKDRKFITEEYDGIHLYPETELITFDDKVFLFTILTIKPYKPHFISSS
jgi:hypothetical protein